MKPTATDARDLAHLLRAVAQREIMPRFRRLGADGIRHKAGPLDLVTDADEAAERALIPAMQSRFPGALIVGEESAAADASLLHRLSDVDLAIVLDPIDGTFNYASGVPLFGVMAAVIARGDVVLSAIHDPMGDDTALALRGEGAWIERPDGTRTDLRVAAGNSPEKLAGLVSWQFLPEPARSTVCRNLPRFAATWNYRCAAHEYRLAAAGHCHFLLYHRLLPWDHAPGWLLHREAGGYSAHFDGTPYEPTKVTRGLICAPHRESWQAIHATLFGD